MPLTVIDHPLVQHKLALLRDERTGSKDFRELVTEVTMLMAFEAMRDLELRGAGNLLGDEQSGHVAALGFELYMQMLDEAVTAAGPPDGSDDYEPVRLDVSVDAFIPADYVPYEQAKIDVALHGTAQIDLWLLERGLQATLQEDQAAGAIEADLELIVRAARETGRLAGLAASDVDVVYFTGGSTGLTPLVDRIAACFPAAQQVRGDRFASVAQGLGWHARAVFGAGS